VSIEEKNMIAVMAALVLLALCVLLFSASREFRKLQKHLPIMLWCFGIVPGICGVVWGFVVFLTTNTTQIILPAFLLLEIASGSLLRVVKNADEQT